MNETITTHKMARHPKTLCGVESGDRDLARALVLAERALRQASPCLNSYHTQTLCPNHTARDTALDAIAALKETP